jgi:hypothetical protein
MEPWNIGGSASRASAAFVNTELARMLWRGMNWVRWIERKEKPRQLPSGV